MQATNPRFVTFDYKERRGSCYGLGYLTDNKDDPTTWIVIEADSLEEFKDEAAHLLKYYFEVWWSI
jgi:hypothetical protein